MKRLFRVAIEFEAYAYAENEAEARDFAHEIVTTEDPGSCWADEVKPGQGVSWHQDALVYHDGEDDLPIHEAMRRLENPTDHDDPDDS